MGGAGPWEGREWQERVANGRREQDKGVGGAMGKGAGQTERVELMEDRVGLESWGRADPGKKARDRATGKGQGCRAIQQFHF
jgi:hypothetical protein